MSPVEIFEITPHAPDKYYGRLLNKQIAESSAEWICVRDRDTTYLTTGAADIMQRAIHDNPDAALMTSRTNRVADERFTMGEFMFAETDINEHIEVAKTLEGLIGEYMEIDGIVPGHFWLFPRSTWNITPFDDHPIVVEGDASFDVRWTRQITGKKILILGLFLFHLYRLDREHRWDTDHLRL
jgi:hypothetical protein